MEQQHYLYHGPWGNRAVSHTIRIRCEKIKLEAPWSLLVNSTKHFRKKKLYQCSTKMQLTATLLLQLSAGFSLPQTSSCSPPTGTGFSSVFSLHIPLRLYASFSKAKALSLAKIVILKFSPNMSWVQGEGSWGESKTMRKGPSKVLVVTTEQWT